LFGVFTALNFFHWFLFWELSLVPAFFAVRFGGRPEQTRAALQFFLYTMVGSVAMLLSFLTLYRTTGTFDFVELVGRGSSAGNWIFAGVLLGLVVKAPMVPFHTWLPATYAEAPTGASMVLTGALSKMGLYGLLRILLPIFPAQVHAWLTPLLWLAIATIVLPAAAALAQNDLKRVVAYSSINHLGYCLLGVFAAAAGGAAGQISALNGVVVQMFNHGITAASLFYFVGLIEERGGVRGLNDFGGLRKAAPVFAGLMGVAVFASVGLPGLNGFVGEFLIFKGVFALAGWAAAAALPGLLLTSVFLLTLWRKVWHGPLSSRWDGWPDLDSSERWAAAAAVAGMFALGLFPQILLGITNPAVMQLVNHLNF
jgi:NADH-quinone oxidoreductase subunit M